MQLQDLEGGARASAESQDDDEHLRYESLAHERLYLSVKGAENSYAMALNIAGCDCEVDRDCPGEQICREGRCERRPSCEDDPFEENDQLSSAAPIEPGDHQNLMICSEDEDWYSLPLCQGGRLSVEAHFLHSNGDLDIALYDAEGLTLGSSRTTGDIERLEYEASADELLFLRIGGLGSASNLYRLLLERQGCEEGLCVDDRFEENDDDEQANSLEPGLYENLQICSEDPDNYRLTLCEGGSLDAEIRFEHALGDLKLGLFSAEGVRLDSSDGIEDQESVHHSSSEAQQLLLRVEGFLRAENSYELEINFSDCACQSDEGCEAGFRCQESLCVSTAPCVDDPLEENDQPESASVLPLEESPLMICAGDEDWFSFQLCEGGELQVDLRFIHADGDLDMSLKSLDGRRLLNRISSDDDESLWYQASEAMELRLQVRGYDGAQNSYRMEASIQGCAQAPLCLDDGMEQNSDRESATPLSFGDYSQLMLCGEDEDWYRLESCVGGQITAAIRFQSLDGDLDMELLSGEGAVLVEGSSGSDDEEIRHLNPEGGDLYLRVFGYQGAENRYDLELSQLHCRCENERDCSNTEVCQDGICVEIPPCEEDPFEENDILSEAPNLGPGNWQDLKICPLDPDLYAIQICEGGQLNAGISFTHAQGDLNLLLLDAQINELAHSITENDGEALSWVSSDNQIIFLGVFSYQESRNSYDLDLEILGCDQQLCVDDELEENDTLQSARPIGAGIHQDLMICANDPDYYSIQLCEGGSLTADLSFLHAEGDLDLQLWEGETLLLRSAGYEDGESLRFSAEHLSELQLQVLGHRGVENRYDLDIQIQGCQCTRDSECPDAQICEAGLCEICISDLEEPNNDLSSAELLSPGSSGLRRLCPNEEDWYMIPVCAGGELRAEMSFLHAEGDLELTLQDSEGLRLAWAMSSSDDELITYTAEQDTWAALRVFQVVGDSNSYTLDLSIQGCAQDCVDDLREPDNSPEEASLLEGALPWQSICEDNDWYRIEVCAGSPLNLHMEFVDDDGDLDLELQDAEGNRLERSTGVGDLEEIRYTPEELGVLYLKVYGYSEAKNHYSLFMEQACSD